MENPLWRPLMGKSRKKKKKLVQIKVRVDKSNTYSRLSAFTLITIVEVQYVAVNRWQHCAMLSHSLVCVVQRLTHDTWGER